LPFWSTIFTPSALHARHARRHQMHDAGDLVGREDAAAAQVHHHRGGGALVVAQEGGLLGHRQVHPGAGHRVDRLHGAGQLALERALVVDLLVELRDAELLPVHQLEAGEAALGQAVGRQAQACLVHLRLRHQDGVAGGRHAVGDVALLQFGDDLASVALVEVGEQHRVFGRAVPQQGTGHQRDRQRDRHRAGDLLALAEGGEVLQRLLHARRSLRVGGGGARGQVGGVFCCGHDGGPVAYALADDGIVRPRVQVPWREKRHFLPPVCRLPWRPVHLECNP
jgi:hypothetical protein